VRTWVGPAVDPPVLAFFNSWNTIQRQQRALFCALARWQEAPERDLGHFGLSVTADIASDCGLIAVQFVLHHQSGGRHESGIVRFEADRDCRELGWFVDAAKPLLCEFLLPSALICRPSIPGEPVARLRLLQA